MKYKDDSDLHQGLINCKLMAYQVGLQGASWGGEGEKTGKGMCFKSASLFSQFQSTVQQSFYIFLVSQHRLPERGVGRGNKNLTKNSKVSQCHMFVDILQIMFISQVQQGTQKYAKM